MSWMKKYPPQAPAQPQHGDEIPRSGRGAASALLAMLKKRQARARSQPLPSTFAPSRNIPE